MLLHLSMQKLKEKKCCYILVCNKAALKNLILCLIFYAWREKGKSTLIRNTSAALQPCETVPAQNCCLRKETNYWSLIKDQSIFLLVIIL